MRKESKITSKDNALPIVTCHKAYYAIKNKENDEHGNLSYAKPKYLENLTEIGIEKNFSTDPFYAEGSLKYNETTLTEIPVTIATGDLTEDNEIEVMGHKKDKNGLVVRNKDDIAPDLALMFTVKKAEGIYKGYVFYDGKFVQSGINAGTSEGSANYQTKTITANFKPLDNGITDASKVLTSEAEVEAFFESVPIPDFTE